jgi:hypothetical protein
MYINIFLRGLGFAIFTRENMAEELAENRCSKGVVALTLDGGSYLRGQRPLRRRSTG